MSCINGHSEILKVLIAKDASDINAKDDNGVAPIHCACGNGHVNALEVLLANTNVDVNANVWGKVRFTMHVKKVI